MLTLLDCFDSLVAPVVFIRLRSLPRLPFELVLALRALFKLSLLNRSRLIRLRSLPSAVCFGFANRHMRFSLGADGKIEPLSQVLRLVEQVIVCANCQAVIIKITLPVPNAMIHAHLWRILNCTMTASRRLYRHRSHACLHMRHVHTTWCAAVLHF